jgi:hypothetical protein
MYSIAISILNVTLYLFSVLWPAWWWPYMFERCNWLGLDICWFELTALLVFDWIYYISLIVRNTTGKNRLKWELVLKLEFNLKQKLSGSYIYVMLNINVKIMSEIYFQYKNLQHFECYLDKNVCWYAPSHSTMRLHTSWRQVTVGVLMSVRPSIRPSVCKKQHDCNVFLKLFVNVVKTEGTYQMCYTMKTFCNLINLAWSRDRFMLVMTCWNFMKLTWFEINYECVFPYFYVIYK